jgi:superfamily I DNA/RNA helicase
VLGLAASLPGLRRVDLITNYRCPKPVVERAVRLVEHNRERFTKRIVPGPSAAGGLILAPDASDDVVRVGRAMASWPPDGSTRAVLARTNRELLVAVVAALDLGLPFRAPDLPLPIEDERLDPILDSLAGASAEMPLLVALGRLRRDLLAAAQLSEQAPSEEVAAPADEPSLTDLATALLGWAARFADAAALRGAVAERRAQLAALRRDEAGLTLATAHGTKGLEWDHVVVLADGFPGRRSVTDAAEPERALEEERRLAYVAWTRARRTLTLLYDPASPSPFLREAFSPHELGIEAAAA